MGVLSEFVEWGGQRFESEREGKVEGKCPTKYEGEQPAYLSYLPSHTDTYEQPKT